MRRFVCVAGFALVGFGLAACGSVRSPSGDGSTGGGTDGKTGNLVDGAVDSPVDGSSTMPLCTAPSNTPTTKYWISLFKDADGHSGPDNSCPKVGMSFASTNPQYVWCRRMGGMVSDSNGNHNYWWLWTDLDQGGDSNGRGWISAYYIQGQGNNEANDMYTGNPIPSCP